MADLARLITFCRANRGAANRLINTVNNFIVDASLSRTHLIHQTRREIDSLDIKLTLIEECDNDIFQLTATADLEAEVDNTDQTNQVIRDARDNFEFLLTTLQDAENAANPEINRDWLPLSVADERWQTSWGGK